MTGSKFYKNCLSEDLQNQVATQLKLLTTEQLSLNEEVAIHRARCGDAVKEWSNARDMAKRLEEEVAKASPEEQAEMQPGLRAANAFAYAAGERMADALKMQKDMVATAAVSDAKTKEVLTQNTLMLLMNGVLDLVHEFFNQGTEDSIFEMKRFEDALRDRVVIQEADQEALAVECEVWGMIESVPTA